MPVRILVADDHEIVREGIRTLISRSGRGWEICGEASDGEEAIERVRTLRPDVVILDITMPKLSGLEAASQIAKLGSGSRILMFTMHESERLAAEVHQAHAQGLVLKSQAARDLVRAIDELLSGGSFFGTAAGTKSGPKSGPGPGGQPLADSGGQCLGKARRPVSVVRRSCGTSCRPDHATLISATLEPRRRRPFSKAIPQLDPALRSDRFRGTSSEAGRRPAARRLRKPAASSFG
jgi:CheY-like chemotaxis protein